MTSWGVQVVRTGGAPCLSSGRLGMQPLPGMSGVGEPGPSINSFFRKIVLYTLHTLCLFFFFPFSLCF